MVNESLFLHIIGAYKITTGLFDAQHTTSHPLLLIGNVAGKQSIQQPGVEIDNFITYRPCHSSLEVRNLEV